MDSVPIQRQTYIQSLFRASQTAIDFGVVASTLRERERFWSAWGRFLSFNFPTYDTKLSTLSQPERIDVLVLFAQHVRSGSVSTSQRKVRAQTVQVSLRAVASKFEMDGEPSPVATSQGKYHKKIGQLIEGYRRNDPAPQYKLAVPLTVPAYMYSYGRHGTTKHKAIGDMAIIAFFYLLRVGEYTKEGNKRTRTQQFRINDITLWNNKSIMDKNLPISTLLEKCTAATLNIDNQKNGRRNQSVHHEAQTSDICPVKALIRRIKHILFHTSNVNTIISTHFSRPKGQVLRGTDINAAIKAAVIQLGLPKYGFNPDQISSHSLRAGGAMALHLNHQSSATIRKMGRWSSDTFLDYIHNQIAAFSSGLSTAMSKDIFFQNIGFQKIETPIVTNAD